MEGIVGFTRIFREEVIAISEGSTIVFAGSNAVCAPFAELLAYAIRDKKFDLYFSPLADEKDCRRMTWREGTGYGIDSIGKEVRGVAAVIVLGGLAMPKFGCKIEKVQEFIAKTSNHNDTKVIGVCFMDILKKSGWTSIIKFDALINSTMETEKQI